MPQAKKSVGPERGVANQPIASRGEAGVDGIDLLGIDGDGWVGLQLVEVAFISIATPALPPNKTITVSYPKRDRIRVNLYQRFAGLAHTTIRQTNPSFLVCASQDPADSLLVCQIVLGWPLYPRFSSVRKRHSSEESLRSICPPRRVLANAPHHPQQPTSEFCRGRRAD